MNLPQLPLELQHQLLDLRYRKHRHALGLVVIEGQSQIKELLSSDWELEYAVTTASTRPPELPDSLLVYETSPQFLDRVSELQHPPNCFVVAKFPVHSLSQLSTQEPIIFLDALADPGNFGTMLRTGEWFGITQWLLGPGTVDSYNPKVVRAAMGSLPRLKIVTSQEPLRDLELLKQAGMSLVATLPETTTNSELNDPNICLLFGSEAHGLGAEYIKLADQTYSIPRYGPTESLNVAVAFAITAFRLRS